MATETFNLNDMLAMPLHSLKQLSSGQDPFLGVRRVPGGWVYWERWGSHVTTLFVPEPASKEADKLREDVAKLIQERDNLYAHFRKTEKRLRDLFEFVKERKGERIEHWHVFPWAVYPPNLQRVIVTDGDTLRTAVYNEADNTFEVSDMGKGVFGDVIAWRYAGNIDTGERTPTTYVQPTPGYPEVHIKELAVGTVLTAIDECQMPYTREATLAVGAQYVIQAVLNGRIKIIDARGHDHWFTMDTLYKHFELHSHG